MCDFMNKVQDATSWSVNKAKGMTRAVGMATTSIDWEALLDDRE